MIASILHLLFSPSMDKFNRLKKAYDKLVDPKDKGIFALILEYYNKFQLVPSLKEFQGWLADRKLSEIMVHLENWIKHTAVNLEEPFHLVVDRDSSDLLDGEFVEFHEDLKKRWYESKQLVTYSEELQKSISKMNQLYGRIVGDSSNRRELINGEQMNHSWYTDRDQLSRLPFPGLDLKVKLGQLMMLVGQTSHGKSLLLRNIAYRLITSGPCNVLYITLEDSLEDNQIRFRLLHANNTEIFPSENPIKASNVLSGQLNEGEFQHLFGTAEKDLRTNPTYGNLYLVSPGKIGFGYDNLVSLVDELDQERLNERDYWQTDVVVLDYLGYMKPDKIYGASTREEWASMVQRIKQWAEAKNILLISAFQTSRTRYKEAEKRDGEFDVMAATDYPEVERSSDILATIYMPPEYRRENRLKIQIHKNRAGDSGGVYDFSVDLNHGQLITHRTIADQINHMELAKNLTI